MNLTSLECFAIDKLNCGTSDLCMLDNVYSTLAEECCNVDAIVDSNDSLDSILFEVYYSITSYIKDAILDKLNYSEPLDIYINNEYCIIENTEHNKKVIKQLCEELTNNEPYCNCLDTHFQNNLDQTVDFDNSVSSNIQDLLSYWVESEDGNITYKRGE